jgi:excisionase family DNA binding protein
MSKNEEVLGVGGLAKWLDVDRDTVRSWVDHHRIPFFKIGDHVYFLRETLLHWFVQLERENPANRDHNVVFTDFYSAARPTSPELYKPTIRFEGDENPGETSKSLRTHVIGSLNDG